MHDHRPRDCLIDPHKATINRFKFPYHDIQKSQKISIAEGEKHRQEKLAAKANGTYVEEEGDDEDHDDRRDEYGL